MALDLIPACVGGLLVGGAGTEGMGPGAAAEDDVVTEESAMGTRASAGVALELRVARRSRWAWMVARRGRLLVAARGAGG